MVATLTLVTISGVKAHQAISSTILTSFGFGVVIGAEGATIGRNKEVVARVAAIAQGHTRACLAMSSAVNTGTFGFVVVLSVRTAGASINALIMILGTEFA